MGATPLVAIESPTGTTGSDGLAVFTFAQDIDAVNHLIIVDRLTQGKGIDYTVTATRQITFIAPSIPLATSQIWLLDGVVGTTITTSLPAWDTVAEIISDTAIDLGLASAAIADPFASSDPNILQLISLLKRGGRILAKQRDWTHLQKEYSFATVASTAAYALPSDFRKMIDQTGWNRTTQWPLGGPTSPQVWQYLQAVPSATAFYVEFRPLGGQFKFTPTPTAIQTIAFEYLSIFWIRPSGQTSPTSDVPTAAADVVCFDPALAVAMLKLEFRKAKKMDASSEQEDFDQVLAMVAGDDSPSPVLSLTPAGGFHLLGDDNVPDTGYGA